MARMLARDALQIEMEMLLCGLFMVDGYGMVYLEDGWKPAQLWLPFVPMATQSQTRLM
jgi:hypothetical protein